MCVSGELIGTHMRASERAYRQSPTSAPILPSRWSKSPLSNFSHPVGGRRKCQCSTVRTLWLVLKWCNEQPYSFCRSAKWVITNRAQYVWSSSGPITTVVIALSGWGFSLCIMQSVTLVIALVVYLYWTAACVRFYSVVRFIEIRSFLCVWKRSLISLCVLVWKRTRRSV